MFLSSAPNPPWCDPGRLRSSGCVEARGARESRESGTPRQEDLHLGRVDPSELMRPIVWASIISLLHPEPGRAQVMHHKVQAFLDTLWTVSRAQHFSWSLDINSVDQWMFSHQICCAFALPTLMCVCKITPVLYIFIYTYTHTQRAHLIKPSH